MKEGTRGYELEEGGKVCLRSSRRKGGVQCIIAAMEERKMDWMDRQNRERREVHPCRVSGSEGEYEGGGGTALGDIIRQNHPLLPSSDWYKCCLWRPWGEPHPLTPSIHSSIHPSFQFFTPPLFSLLSRLLSGLPWGRQWWREAANIRDTREEGRPRRKEGWYCPNCRSMHHLMVELVYFL